MPVDLAPILAPSQCALLVFECQEGAIGEASAIPGLAADPPGYLEPALRYSVRNVAFLSNAAEIAKVWEAA